MKKLTLIALSLLLLAALTLPALAYPVTVQDKAQLLDADAEARLTSAAAEAHGLRFYLLTQRVSSRDDIPSDDRMESICGITRDDAAVVLLVSVVNGSYYYDMYTYNDAYDMFSDRDVDAVLDAFLVNDNLKAGRIEEVPSPDHDRLNRFFHETCEKGGLVHDNDRLFAYFHEFPETRNPTQISMWDNLISL